MDFKLGRLNLNAVAQVSLAHDAIPFLSFSENIFYGLGECFNGLEQRDLFLLSLLSTAKFPFTRKINTIIMPTKSGKFSL